jgi:beta-lactamase class D
MNVVINRILALAALCLALIPTCYVQASNQDHKTHDLSPIFDRANVSGTFTMLNDQTGNFVRFDPKRAATRYLPASKFQTL